MGYVLPQQRERFRGWLGARRSNTAPPPVATQRSLAPSSEYGQNSRPPRESQTRGAVWKGGELLARELLARPELVRGMRVAELGTGTGIVGLAAAAAGARAVTLTDQSLDAATVTLGLGLTLVIKKLTLTPTLTLNPNQATLRVNPTLADRVSLRSLRWGDHYGGSALSPPFEVISLCSRTFVDRSSAASR